MEHLHGMGLGDHMQCNHQCMWEGSAMAKGFGILAAGDSAQFWGWWPKLQSARQ